MTNSHLNTKLIALFAACVLTATASAAHAATVISGTLGTFSAPGGLDLTGDFIYASSLGGDAAGTNVDGIRVIGGLDFSDQSVAGMTVSGGNYNLGSPAFPDSELNTLIDTILDSEPQIDLAVDAGSTYKLQLMMWEPFFTASAARVFNIEVEGAAVVTGLDLAAEHGAGSTTTAVVYTLTLEATDSSLHINTLGTTNVGLFSGLTLEKIVIPTAPEPSTLVLACLGLVGLVARRRRRQR